MSAQEDNSFITEALPAFISEAGEQLEMLEQLLLQLEDEPDSEDLLGALFRCAHTVKGSAGIFGLDAVVAFTHHVESLRDRLRSGDLPLTPELSTLLLQGNDAIRDLVAAAPGAGPADAAQQRQALGAVGQAPLLFVHAVEGRELEARVVALLRVRPIGQAEEEVAVGAAGAPDEAPDHDLPGQRALDQLAELRRVLADGVALDRG